MRHFPLQTFHPMLNFPKSQTAAQFNLVLKMEFLIVHSTLSCQPRTILILSLKKINSKVLPTYLLSFLFN